MPRIDPNKVLWKEVDGLVVVLLVSSGYFIELNKIGSVIWKLLALGKTVNEVIDAMAETYDVSNEKLSSDVNAFIEEMMSQGLLAG